jgi:hypothetical protein
MQDFSSGDFYMDNFNFKLNTLSIVLPFLDDSRTSLPLTQSYFGDHYVCWALCLGTRDTKLVRAAQAPQLLSPGLPPMYFILSLNRGNPKIH